MTDGADTGAILLAGGRASRLGGIDKPLLEIDGRSLLQRAWDAVARCDGMIIAGPERTALAGSAAWVREDPPFTGPAAAIVAALAAWPDAPAWMYVLACDLVDPVAAVAALAAGREAISADVDGLCLADGESRPQWLTGLYRTAPLRRAADALPGVGANAPVRALTARLSLQVIAATGRETIDIDTWNDAERAGARLPPRTHPTEETST